jgi:hypothetical protein
MRPRIHHAFMAEIRMLDAVATRAETGPAQLQSGFDDEFQEIVVVSTPAGRRHTERREQPPVFVPSQVEDPTFDVLRQLATGAQLDTKLTLVWAAKDLVRLGLIVPETGEPLIRQNDRLVSIRDRHLNVVQEIRTPPGLYVTEVRPLWGIAQRRDLWLVNLQDRAQGSPA